MSLLPSSPDVAPDGEPRVVGLDSEEADDIMAALSSATARCLLAEIHDEPAPPGELADRADTSLQNAQYHLEKLEDAGAVEVVGTAYSEKGREMRVYGPADDPLVIFAGRTDRTSGLRAALSRLFGGFAALAVVSVIVQQVFGGGLLGSIDDDAEPGATTTPEPDAGEATPAETATPAPDDEPPDESEEAATPAPDDEEDAAAYDGPDAETVDDSSYEVAETPTPTEAHETPTPGAGDYDLPGVLEGVLATGLPPGVAFFLGGATVLTVLVAVSYYRAYP